MIHFFLTFSRNAADSPFGRRLAEMGVESRIMAGEVRHRYKHRAWMIFVGRPQTALFALRAAVQSLLLEKPVPRAVVVWTHIEALVVALLRWALRRRHTRLVLVGFILTARTGMLHQLLRRWYFELVFSVVDLAIVHSRAEAERYTQQFPKARTSFVFIPWGSHIDNLEELASRPPADGPADVLAAGRSGRDYRTLYEALAGTPLRVKIVCDLADALSGCTPAANIQVLDHCYGAEYLREVLHARCIAIPLGVSDISAGQMALLQAMELGKPVVMTSTATTVDYVRHDHDALLVEAGSAPALQAAVARVIDEPDCAARLGANARQSFTERFTVPALVTKLVAEIRVLDPQAGGTAP